MPLFLIFIIFKNYSHREEGEEGIEPERRLEWQ
jgi:hypothetical protein